GTSFRQGAISVTQLEIMPQPPEKPDKGTTWPLWPYRLRTSSSQAEGAVRDWCVSTTKFSGKDGKLTTLHVTRLDDKLREIPGSEFTMPAELVLLAMGFVHPVHEGMLEGLGIELDGRGNVKANTLDYQTSSPKLFAAGDMRRGQSLVVWAIREGRQCARAIDEFLMGESVLPR
ncbi:MAG: glutamate synthase, partial [Rhodospirillaceae bacterium]|nr:glutamate synthase [Rhodospirillaceae bacterium]